MFHAVGHSHGHGRNHGRGHGRGQFCWAILLGNCAGQFCWPMLLGHIAGWHWPSGCQKYPAAAPRDQVEPKSQPPADRKRKETWEGVGKQGVREVLGTRRVTVRAGTGRAAAKNLPQQVPTTKLTITKFCFGRGVFCHSAISKLWQLAISKLWQWASN